MDSFYPHEKRSCEAMDERGIIPLFDGVLIHDHWKPYYRYTQALHSLCNAHHSRELLRAFGQDGQSWAQEMEKLLMTINNAVHDAGGALDNVSAENYRQRYQALLKRAEIECPAPKAETCWSDSSNMKMMC